VTRNLLPAALLLLAGMVPAGAAPPEKVPRGSVGYGAGKVVKPEFEDLVRKADLIVMGRVIQIGGIPHPGPSRNRPRSKRYTYWEDSYAIIEIERCLKGKAPARIKVAYHSDLEGDKTVYQAGRHYIAFLLRPGKYPDSFTTAGFHFGQFRINDQGRAERVNDPSEISKPVDTVIDRIHQVLQPPAGKS
jgi:hypothetical protein